MFTALPLSKPSTPSLPASNTGLLASLTATSQTQNATNLANDFARAMDRAQDRQKPLSLQPPAPPAAPARSTHTVAPSGKTKAAEPPARQALQTPTHQGATQAPRPAQNNAAVKTSHAAAREVQRDTAPRNPPHPQADSSTDPSTDSAAQTTRRSARARSSAEDSATENAASAAMNAADSPNKATPAPQVAATAAAGTGDTGNTVTDAKKIGTHTTLNSLGLRYAECPEHAPALPPAGGGDLASRSTNAQAGPGSLSGLSGQAIHGAIGSSVGARLGSAIDTESVANTNASLALNTNIQGDGKIGKADVDTPGPIAFDPLGDTPGGVRPDLRMNGPVREFWNVPHPADQPGSSTVKPAAPTTPSAAMAANADTTTLATPAAAPAATALAATLAGGWRFVREPTVPNAADPSRAAALAALGPAIGAMNGLTPEARSRAALNPFSPLRPDTTTPATAGAESADSATMTRLAAPMGSTEIASPQAPADTATGVPPTSARATLESTANGAATGAATAAINDWQRSANTTGTGQRQDSRAADQSARVLATTAELLWPSSATAATSATSATPDSQPRTLVEPGLAGLPSFAAALAAQSASIGSAVEGTVNARPTSAEFAAEVSQKITVLVMDGVQTAKLHLNPADMGPVTVQIQIDGATAQVHLAADNSETRQALQDSMPQLASQLRESGLTLTGGGVFEQPRQTPQEPPQDQRAAQPDVKEHQRDGAGDSNPAQNLRAGVPGGTAARRGLVDLVA